MAEKYFCPEKTAKYLVNQNKKSFETVLKVSMDATINQDQFFFSSTQFLPKQELASNSAGPRQEPKS